MVMHWVGVDVGGTFTDVVVYDETTGTLAVGKATTSTQDPTVGLVNALGKLQVSLAETSRVVHGTTIGTNAILERKGAEVWLLTTRGFRDTLEIARTNRTILYDIRAQKPAPLVPRERVLEIAERMSFEGTVLQPLDPDEVRAAAGRMRSDATPGAPAAVVVGFLHSYANPVHERAAATALGALLPGWYVCTSEEVLPELREYERLSTASLNAYIGPKVGGYLTHLRSVLGGRGYRGEVFITTSSGGIMTAQAAARFPVHTVLSGPAGGVAAAVNLGRASGVKNLITYDMGGTSTDVCLIEDLEPTLTTEQHIAGLPNRTPQIEINSIGAGGGSLAWLDAGDVLRVGPRSAGADPGPACYARGGVEPTITDANVVLGRVATDAPLAGEVTLQADLAQAAVGRLRARMSGIPDDAALAEGIVRIAVARMVGAIKEISIAKGHDPRDFTLLAYGGAGPMHAALVAEELEIPRVIVPTAPGNFSAFGSLISDLRRDYVRTRLTRTQSAQFTDVEAAFGELEREARAQLAAEGIAVDRISTIRMFGMRYVGQSWELIVRMPEAAASMSDVDEAFRRAHERRYGHAGPGAIEIVNFRLTAVGAVPKPTLPRWTVAGAVDGARRLVRRLHFGGDWAESPVYHRSALALGGRFSGPAIVEEMGATTVVPPGWSGRVGELGELVLERRSL
jgi:N-methylhydantoinase A